MAKLRRALRKIKVMRMVRMSKVKPRTRAVYRILFLVRGRTTSLESCDVGLFLIRCAPLRTETATEQEECRGPRTASELLPGKGRETGLGLHQLHSSVRHLFCSGLVSLSCSGPV